MSHDSRLHHAAARQGMPTTSETCRCEGCDELIDVDRSEPLAIGGRTCRHCCLRCEVCDRMMLKLMGACIACGVPFEG